MQNWADIQALLDNRIPESEVLDYKRDCYGNSDNHKRELLKDVSSFANSRGGHIIIGVDEEEGVPTDIVGIDASVNLDAEIQRMVQIINSGFDPAFTNVQIRIVTDENNVRCMVLDIPRSGIGPHRIAFGRHHKFFVRDSNGKHEATMPELRNMFTLSDQARRRFRDFTRDRIDIIQDQDRDTTGVNSQQGLLVCHIIPQMFLLTEHDFDIDALYNDHFQMLRPIDVMGLNRRYNFDGFMVYSGGEQLNAYVQVFKDGTIESVLGAVVHQDENMGAYIAGQWLEQHFFQAFPDYLNAYAAINIPPPYVVQLSLVGVRGVHYAYQDGRVILRQRQPLFDRDRMYLVLICIQS